MRARISFDGGNEWLDARVWRYSPFGVELISSGLSVNKGQSIDLKLEIAGCMSRFGGLVVADRYTDDSVELFGLRLFSKITADDPTMEKRGTMRWRCSEAFLPTGTAANPAKFNDYIFFRVEDISATGMRIVTSMRNKLLMRGQRLESTLSVPCVGAIQCNFEVKRIDFSTHAERDYIVLGVEFLRRDNLLLKVLAEYLLQFGEGVTAQSLVNDGFPLNNAFRRFDFSYVKTEKEYDEVLELRYRSYQAAGKLAENASPKSMSDEFDARSRILIVKHNDKVVGSVRVIFHEDSDRLSYGRYFDVPPEGLPPKSEYAEASRLCTDPTYRGAEIAYHLVEHMVLTTVQSGRKYIVSGAAGSLLDLWSKCGFKRLGINYRSLDFGGMPHELILMNTHEVALGKGIDLRLWNRVFGRLVVYMLENRLVSPTPADMIRINTVKLAARIGLLR